MVTDIRFLADGKHLRIYQNRNKSFYAIDVNVYDLTPDVKKLDHRWEDRTIYKYGLTYVKEQESLGKFISGQ